MTTTLAEAYANAGKALLDLADAIDAETPPKSRVAADAPSFDELPPDEWPAPPPGPDEGTMALERHGSAAVCPAHGKPYSQGRYGPYCREKSDEPGWSNERGYCQVTPKSAVAWLRQHSGQAA